MSKPYEVAVRQWFHTGLSEKEGRQLVGQIKGTMKYGLLVPYTDLPEEAKAIARGEFNLLHNPLGIKGEVDGVLYE
jgi:hypothetical protein